MLFRLKAPEFFFLRWSALQILADNLGFGPSTVNACYYFHVVIPSFLPLYEFCGGGFCLFPSIIDGSEIIFKIFLWVWNIFSECVKRLGTIERGDGRVEVGSLAVGYL